MSFNFDLISVLIGVTLGGALTCGGLGLSKYPLLFKKVWIITWLAIAVMMPLVWQWMAIEGPTFISQNWTSKNEHGLCQICCVASMLLCIFIACINDIEL